MKRIVFTLCCFVFLGATVPAAAADGEGFTYVPSDAVYRMTEVAPVHFLDVRGSTAYRQEHIRGALDMPLVLLRRGKLPDLDKNATVVTYCGCPHAMAEDAARLLVKAGFKNVIVLDDGFYAWKDRGYPVESSAKKESFRKIGLSGKILDPALAGKPLEVMEPRSGQMERGFIGADGTFRLHLPFYGAVQGRDLIFMAGERSWRKPLRAYDDLVLP